MCWHCQNISYLSRCTLILSFITVSTALPGTDVGLASLQRCPSCPLISPLESFLEVGVTLPPSSLRAQKKLEERGRSISRSAISYPHSLGKLRCPGICYSAYFGLQPFPASALSGRVSANSLRKKGSSMGIICLFRWTHADTSFSFSGNVLASPLFYSAVVIWSVRLQWPSWSWCV